METRVLKPAAERLDDPAVAEAAARLQAGEIVGLPTETVYGLAAVEGDDAALGRLRELKGRDVDQPFTLACATRDLAFAHAAFVPITAARLAERYWPGPLTLVLPAAGGDTIGVRVPGNALARLVLEAARGAAWLPSANPAHEPPPDDAAGVVRYFDGRIPLVLDGGRSPIGQSSTIVRCDRDRLEVVRTGLLSSDDIFGAAQRRILFVCSGNTCRSPMAATLLRAALARKLGVPPERLDAAGYVVGSAGMHAYPGEPASSGAQHAMHARGLDVTAHQARRLSPALLAAQDRVYVMTERLLVELRRLTPNPERVRLVDPDGKDIVDPFGGPDAEYDRCAAALDERIARIAEEA